MSVRSPLVAAALVTGVVSATATIPAATAQQPVAAVGRIAAHGTLDPAVGRIAAHGPFLTLLFSRTEVTAADGSDCHADNHGIVRLDSVVAPYLANRGLRATGTLVTGLMKSRALLCDHFGETLETSWQLASHLATAYGWYFTSHSATYANDWANMTPSEIRYQTCGSRRAIERHGLPGASGLFAYPDNSGTTEIQADYVSKCFAFGRVYARGGITTRSVATTPPYWQYTDATNGGYCNDPNAACHGTHGSRYRLPSLFIARMQSLAADQWLTLQTYLLVTGKSPAYTTDGARWDCTSPDPAEHWTNEVERYCWSDYQTILAAIPTTVTVTDPASVGAAWGRTVP